MIRTLFIILFFLMSFCSSRADENSSDDQAFLKQLNEIKNPFEDGLPKPVIVAQPVVQPSSPKPVYHPPPPPAPIVLPDMSLDGVMVGDGMQEAIINNAVVSLGGDVEGAVLLDVSKQGVHLLYKRRKFFLSVE